MRVFDPELNQKTGFRVRECRKATKMTQKDLAAKVNITAQHLYNIESGKRTLTADLAKSIGSALNVWDQYLLCKNDFKTYEELQTNIDLEKSRLYKKALADQKALSDFDSKHERAFIDFINSFIGLEIERSGDRFSIRQYTLDAALMKYIDSLSDGNNSECDTDCIETYYSMDTILISDSVFKRMLSEVGSVINNTIAQLIEYRNDIQDQNDKTK